MIHSVLDKPPVELGMEVVLKASLVPRSRGIHHKYHICVLYCVTSQPIEHAHPGDLLLTIAGKFVHFLEMLCAF